MLSLSEIENYLKTICSTDYKYQKKEFLDIFEINWNDNIYACSTNSNILVVCKGSYNFSNEIPEHINQIISNILIKPNGRAFKKYDLPSTLSIFDEEVDCKDCKGKGIIDFGYVGNHEYECECQECNGEGIKIKKATVEFLGRDFIVSNFKKIPPNSKFYLWQKNILFFKNETYYGALMSVPKD